MTMTEAAEYLEVTRATLRRWVKSKGLTVQDHPGDERKKLLLTSEIRELKKAIDAVS